MKSKHLFPMLLCCIIPTTSIAGTVIFSDNFETGNFSKWKNSSGGNCVITTEKAHIGTYSQKCLHTIDGSGSGLIVIDPAVALANTEVTISYWWYTANSYEVGKGIKFLRMRTENQEIQMEFFWNDGPEPMVMTAHGYGNEGTDPPYNVLEGYSQMGLGSQPLNRGRWMKITVHYILNTPSVYNGLLEVYFDDVLKYKNTAVSFRKSNIAYNVFSMPSNTRYRSDNMVNYVDDIEILAGTSGVAKINVMPSAPSKLLIQ